MSVLRAYGANGKPAATPSFLALRPEGPQTGELVFVSGASRFHRPAVEPLRSSRPCAMWNCRAGCCAPRSCAGVSSSSAKRAPKRTASWKIRSIVWKTPSRCAAKQLDALLDDRLLAGQARRGSGAAGQVAADRSSPPRSAILVADIAKAQLRERELYLPYTFLELGAGFNSRLFTYARTLVRGGRRTPQTQHRPPA